MVTLVLVRHAKSDWNDPRLKDHDRPLNHRGAQNAPMMAERFAHAGQQVNRIVSSSATRARDTARAFATQLGQEVALDPDLYLASARTLLNTAASQGEQSVMIVAHDPGITELAARLSGWGITHMPTCAVAVFQWGTNDWQQALTSQPASWCFDSPRNQSSR